MCDIVVTEDLPTLEPFQNASKSMIALTWLSEDMTPRCVTRGHEDDGADNGSGNLRFGTFDLLHLPE
jgi:hypothetical protein